MRKMMSLLLVASLLAATTFIGGHNSSAQSNNSSAQSNHAPPNKPSKDDDPVSKVLRKNWDKLPPQAKYAADPRAKAAWERLTPRQQGILRRKALEIIKGEKDKYDKEKADKAKGLKSWDDVEKAQGSKKDEDATLTYLDNNGNRHSLKAKRRDGTVRPERGASAAAAQRRNGEQAASLPRGGRGKAPSFLEEDWAFGAGGVNPKRPGGLRYAKAALASGLAPQAGCIRGPEDFIRNFYLKALARQPSAGELSYWLGQFSQAQSQGNLMPTAQSLGSSLFLSQEYANRGRSNHDFVYDCYAAYLSREPDESGWNFWTDSANQHGQAAVVPGFAYSVEFGQRVGEVCNVASFDGDNDGLPDSFENSLADGFTPAYHVSQGEPDQYATFENSTTLTIKQLAGQTPVSHFRVLPIYNPIRYNPNAGRWESILRIDYLSLWNHDSGTVGELCFLDLGIIPEGLNAHELDGERSAMLVSAPAVCNENGCGVNLDPNAYSALSVYTAAHENTPVDHSDYWDFPSSPRPVGTHLDLWQSLQKHSTYTFDPDYFPILTVEIQVLIFAAIEYYIFTKLCWGSYDYFWDEFLWDYGYYDGFSLSCDFWWEVFIAIIYFTVTILYVCLVERFAEQGATLAPTRINVGEPPGFGGFGVPGGQPLNGSSFILDDTSRAFHLYSKLVDPLRFESLIQ